MSKLAKQASVAGTPGVLVIRDATGKEHTFLVNKPSPNDLILMQRWVVSQPLPDNSSRGISSAELEGLKPEEKLIVLREYAKAKGARRDPTEGETIQLIYSPAGVAMQVWLAARRNHPGLTREAVAALITEANADQVSADLDEAVGAEEGSDDPKAPAGQASSPASSPEASPTPS